MQAEDTGCVRAADAWRICADQRPTPERCQVVVEQPVSISIEGVGCYTLMCTPCDTMALAVGFAFTEGIISSLADINLLQRCEDDPSAIRMQLSRLPENPSDRNLIVTSSCGLCGSADIDGILESLPMADDSLRISMSELLEVLEEMRAGQVIFAKTGGTHAAAIFNSDCDVIAFAEDIGRHNALDKVIGKCMLEGRPTAGCGVSLSGRVSLEMVIKAAKAGIELIAAVSAPSSLAVEASERLGITLCGFVRGDRATVYSYARRIWGAL